MRMKFFTFVIGVLMVLASLIGLLITLGYTPAFISALPQDLRIYFGIGVFLGLATIGLTLNRQVY